MASYLFTKKYVELAQALEDQARRRIKVIYPNASEDLVDMICPPINVYEPNDEFGMDHDFSDEGRALLDEMIKLDLVVKVG